jgi:hypothetical protein
MSIFLTAAFINSVGVGCSILGAFLVWRYLRELSFADEDEFLKGNGALVVPQPTPKEVTRYRRSRTLSKLGLALILFGGLTQIISNHAN